MKENQFYVEVLVNIPDDAECLQQLKSRLDSLSVDWQERKIAPYHITVAFMEEMGDKEKVLKLLDGIDCGGSLDLDSYDVFTEYSGKHHVISLTSTMVPECFRDNVEKLREGLSDAGCKINPDFRLHVTLGRVDAERMSLEVVREMVMSLPEPDLCTRTECTRMIRRKNHSVQWDSSCQLVDENKFTYEGIRTLCYNNENRIIARESLEYILDNRKVRFINPMGYFDFTTFGNFWFDTDGAVYLITKDSRYTRYHKPGVLPFTLWSVVPIIFAGVSTGVMDDTGREIYTGDIVTFDDHFTSMAHYLYWEDEPSLAGDNCDYMFSRSRRSLHIEGTAFCNMTAKMFERFDPKHIHWYCSQFRPHGLSRDEVIRMAKLAVSRPHFVDELKVIPRCAAVYANIQDAMNEDYRLVYIACNEEYDDCDGGKIRDILADNIPYDYDGEYYSIDMVDGDTLAEQLRKPFEEFIVHAHNHPETKFILCDFKERAMLSVRQRKTYEVVKALKPVVDYQIRNIILPEWIYFKLM